MVQGLKVQPATLQSQQPLTVEKKEGAKREFEKLIDDICRLVYRIRSESGHYLDLFVQRAAENSKSQRFWHVITSIVQFSGGPIGAIACTRFGRNETDKTSADMASKWWENGMGASQLLGGIINAIVKDFQAEKERIDHERNQMNTFIGNLQMIGQNLETKRQQYENKQAEVSAVR